MRTTRAVVSYMPTVADLFPTSDLRSSLVQMMPLLRALALIGLLLLPIQMRAGASSPHPHALLHLLLDHAVMGHSTITQRGAAAAATDHHARARRERHHIRPTFPLGISYPRPGWRILTLVTALAILPPRAARTWPAYRRGGANGVRCSSHLLRAFGGLNPRGTTRGGPAVIGRGTIRRYSIMRRISTIAAVGSIALSSLLLLASPLAAEAHEARAASRTANTRSSSVSSASRSSPATRAGSNSSSLISPRRRLQLPVRGPTTRKMRSAGRRPGDDAQGRGDLWRPDHGTAAQRALQHAGRL